MKKVYLFLAYGYEEVETITIVDLLRRARIEAVTVSITENNIVTGAHLIPIITDIKLDENRFRRAEAIILPGGQPGVDNVYACEKVLNLIREKYNDGKIIGAICAAPIILGRMGLLEGKKATCYPGCEDELKGAIISDEKVCVDGNIVTSRGVGTAIDFALELIRLLEGEEKAAEVKASILFD